MLFELLRQETGILWYNLTSIVKKNVRSTILDCILYKEVILHPTPQYITV